MKKFLAVFLAVVVFVLSFTMAFAVSVPLNQISYINGGVGPTFYITDQGNGDCIIPVDLSVTPSNISGSFGGLDSYQEFLRRLSSSEYTVYFTSGSGSTGPIFAIATDSVPLITSSSKSHSSHTDTFYYLSFPNNSPSLYCVYDSTKGAYKPLSCVPSSSASFLLYTNCSTSKYKYNHYFVYPYFETSYNSYIRFLSINSLRLSDISVPLENILTINYQYSNGTTASDPVTQSLAPGAEYSIPSPEVPGYTPDVSLVTGTMPEEDLTVTVTYTKAFYPLTVQYQYTDGSQAAESISFQYPLGFAYDIPSPEIEGYQPDKPAIAGEMPGEALEEVVTYSAIPYTLTVRYRFLDGSQAAPDHQEQLTIGSSYSVPSPVIEGYHPNQTAVTGVMPASDVVSTVTYREDSGGSSGSGSSGPGEGGGSGGEGPGGEGGASGDDPFIPALPPFSGNDPFVIPGLPEFSGYDPFVLPQLPNFSGYDPFMVPQLPSFSGYDPFKMPEQGGS